MRRHQRIMRRTRVNAVVLLSLLVVTALSSPASASVPQGPRLTTGFDAPNSLLVDGHDLFVSNWNGGPTHNGLVTELDAATGALVREVEGPAYRFNGPYLMTAHGDLFIMNGRGD